MPTIKFDVTNRWTGNVQFTAEIECRTAASVAVKLGLAVKWAVKTGADLKGADLKGAYLKGAYLKGAYWGEPPVIENIHQAVYAAASKEGALDMGNWHQDGHCGTTHCRAGWVTHLAGEAGKELEDQIGTPISTVPTSTRTIEPSEHCASVRMKSARWRTCAARRRTRRLMGRFRPVTFRSQWVTPSGDPTSSGKSMPSRLRSQAWRSKRRGGEAENAERRRDKSLDMAGAVQTKARSNMS